MLEAIGNTPLVRLRRLPSPGAAQVWVKLEGGNPTGSYKDRMALAMVEAAEESGEFTANMSFLECTGGSTGSSLAFVCAVKGHKFTVISSDAYAREKLDSMHAFGATVLVEPSVGGEVTPDLWPRMMKRARSLVDEGGYLYLDQFSNPHAPSGYRLMGEEIVRQLGKPIDALCGAVGTAGMITGVGGVVRAAFPAARIVALEPDTSPVLSGGQPGAHGIDGTAGGFVPKNFDRELVTEVLALPESEARETARRLAREEGMFAGTSTGLNVLAALQLADEIGAGGTVVTESVRVLTLEGRLLISVLTPETDLHGTGIRPIPEEPHVYSGFSSGRTFLIDAATLDVKLARRGLEPVVPTKTVRVEVERGRRVVVNGLYEKG